MSLRAQDMAMGLAVPLIWGMGVVFAKAALVHSRAANPYPSGDARHAVWETLTTDAEPVRARTPTPR